MRPTVARSGRIGLSRPDPRTVTWSPADLARRRSAAVARVEAEASEARGDPLFVSRLLTQVADELERLQPGRRR
jgi:hypothetical protein